MCRLCDKNVADVFGDHSLTCMNVGLRTQAHTALQDEVAKLAREAVLTPAVEAAPFIGKGFKRLRLDIMYQREERARMIDVAITFPLQARGLEHAVENPGGDEIRGREAEEVRGGGLDGATTSPRHPSPLGCRHVRRGRS
ncbi:hypothetical protein DIPPA_26154 [Diplonema papillatum]|nr:hypothetical protein DIPPA_26154 [Diplonema papillatum]